MQQDKVGAVPSVFPAGPQCEVLFELFTGTMGVVQLGRFLKGRDAGRLVSLRRLSQPPSPDLASATDLARSIAHPSLAKLLGQIRCGNTWYLASEQISGVTLFELGRAVTERRSPLDVAVAARIVLEALRAADVAQKLLAETAHISGIRCIYPESIWIAEFGEVFLSELLVAPMLADAAAEAPPPSIPPPPLSPASADARSATLELLRLVCEEVRTNDPGLANGSDLPQPLRAILFDDERSGIKSYETLAAFIAALSALPKELLATDQQVSAELKLVMGQVLERRRQKLEMLERFTLQPKEDDATRVFRVAIKSTDEVQTAPPPQNDAERTLPAPALIAKVAAEKRRSEPSSERTKIFGSIAPRDSTLNAQTLEIAGDEPVVESAENPVSAVWRQAQALSARRPARRGLVLPVDQNANGEATISMQVPAAFAAVSLKPGVSARTASLWLLVLAVAAVAAVLLLSTLSRALRHAPPKAATEAPALGDHQKK